jgi:hypothetical protein
MSNAYGRKGWCVMATRDDMFKTRVDHQDTILRTSEAIRRWIAREKVLRRRRAALAHLSQRLKRDVGFDRHAA